MNRDTGWTVLEWMVNVVIIVGWVGILIGMLAR